MTALDPTALEAAAKALFEVYGGYDAETKAHMFMMEKAGLQRRAARAITAYLAHLKPPGPGVGSPEGWRLVPTEPTEAMLASAKPRPAHWPAAGENRTLDAAVIADRAVARQIYIDMLAAAPPVGAP